MTKNSYDVHLFDKEGNTKGRWGRREGEKRNSAQNSGWNVQTAKHPEYPGMPQYTKEVSCQS